MDRDAWHRRQDDQTVASLGGRQDAERHPDAVRRVHHHLAEDELLAPHVFNVVAMFPGDDRLRLIDIGCGRGRLLAAIAERFPNAELVGVDANGDSLDLAESIVPPGRADLRHLRVEAIRDAFDDASFDVVVCSELYEHVYDPDDLLRTCARLLRPGGLLSFSTPSGWMMRVPRLAVFLLMFGRPREYRARRYPERYWERALPTHPGARWSVLSRQLAAAGFGSFHRSSALPWIETQWPSSLTAVRFVRGRRGDGSWFLASVRALGRGNDRRAASLLRNAYLIAQSAMNLFPALRVFESRVVVSALRQS